MAYMGNALLVNSTRCSVLTLKTQNVINLKLHTSKSKPEQKLVKPQINPF